MWTGWSVEVLSVSVGCPAGDMEVTHLSDLDRSSPTDARITIHSLGRLTGRGRREWIGNQGEQQCGSQKCEVRATNR